MHEMVSCLTTILCSKLERSCIIWSSQGIFHNLAVNWLTSKWTDCTEVWRNNIYLMRNRQRCIIHVLYTRKFHFRKCAFSVLFWRHHSFLLQIFLPSLFSAHRSSVQHHRLRLFPSFSYFLPAPSSPVKRERWRKRIGKETDEERIVSLSKQLSSRIPCLRQITHTLIQFLIWIG